MPKLDRRSYEDIVAHTQQLAQTYTLWQPNSDGSPDAGQALIRLFGRMVAGVSDRLNQVPDKNFLAFLDLIGVQRRPPEPARVPVTFYLAAGSTNDALVPAATSIGAELAEGDTEEVLFETEQELVDQIALKLKPTTLQFEDEKVPKAIKNTFGLTTGYSETELQLALKPHQFLHLHHMKVRNVL